MNLMAAIRLRGAKISLTSAAAPVCLYENVPVRDENDHRPPGEHPGTARKCAGL